MPTIAGTMIQNARRVPDREAIVTAEQTWTWAEVEDWTNGIAAFLRQQGVTKGDRVAMLATNSADYIAAAFGALRLGAIVVPVNTRLAPPEVAHIVEDCAPTLILRSPSMADLVSTACDAFPEIGVFGLDAGHEMVDIDQREAIGHFADDVAESDDAFIVYTSGTTGRPKGVVIDHHRAIWAALAQVVSLGLRDGVRYLHLPPLYHSGGVVFMNATTLLGGTHILVDKFEPGAVLTAIDEFGASAMLGVPTMYHALVNYPGVEHFDLSSWRTGIFGAAPMPAPTIEALLRSFPAVEFFQQCGQTEAGPTGIYSTMSQVRSEPNSSGHLAQPFVEVRVVDDTGRDVEPGDVGEMVLRGDPIMKGYWGNGSATADTIVNGWLHTGDLVEVAPTGAMRLVDRRKDIIISGGRNIYSAEVEQALRTHPAVTDCAVIGIPNEEWGETVVAVVTSVGENPVALAELRSHCVALIADYKVPLGIVHATVPRNAAGKSLKHELRAQVNAGALPVQWK